MGIPSNFPLIRVSTKRHEKYGGRIPVRREESRLASPVMDACTELLSVSAKHAI